MPDSNITKKALAMAMKELMEQIPFSKISVSDICEKCGMNRKSFYYHFKDKYDLVNWIFDVEFFRLSMSGITICQTGRGVFGGQLSVFLRKPVILQKGTADWRAEFFCRTFQGNVKAIVKNGCKRYSGRPAIWRILHQFLFGCIYCGVGALAVGKRMYRAGIIY